MRNRFHRDKWRKKQEIQAQIKKYTDFKDNQIIIEQKRIENLTNDVIKNVYTVLKKDKQHNDDLNAYYFELKEAFV